MYLLSIVLLSLVSRFGLAALAVPAAQTPLGDLESKHLPRSATERDLDGIVDTFIAAFQSNPIWQYVHIDDEKYANYTWTCEREEFQELLKNLKPSGFMNVIEDASQDEWTGERDERVVSLAVWLWLKPGDLEAAQFAFKLQGLHRNCSDRLDLNLTRMADLDDWSERNLRPYIENMTEPQLHLTLLATHPDWDGRGFAAAQVEVGLGEAALENMPVTLLSTPVAYPLYDSLDFRSLANFTFVMLDHLGTYWSEFMRWDAKASFD